MRRLTGRGGREEIEVVCCNEAFVTREKSVINGILNPVY